MTITHTTRPPVPAAHSVERARPGWWREAVIYQVYPRSFADANGDGMGDLQGVIQHLDHLVSLGVDAIWLSPFYTSPQTDCGYDVADYCDVDPMFGTLDDFDALVTRSHARGLRILVDIIPNHSSNQHRAFQAALRAMPGSAERAMYLFRDGRGDHGELPPNNWQGTDAGSAWTRVIEPDGRPGQWYLHLFGIDQPDWDWTNPAVAGFFDEVFRFWLRRGVDGFRVDVAHGMAKAEGLPDWRAERTSMVIPTVDPATRPPMWDQDEVHRIHARWREVLDEFGPDRILVAEAWLEPERLVHYVRPDEDHQAFNGELLDTPWRAADLHRAIVRSLETFAKQSVLPTWVLSNHDVVRHASRLGYPAGTSFQLGIGAADPQPDRQLGQRLGRAATLLMLGLPGAAYLYQGEELGLPEVTDLPDRSRTDYRFLESAGVDRGRDGCRVPLPWQGNSESFGFSTGGTPWLPQPHWFSEFAVDVAEVDPDSTLWLYRTAIQIRGDLRLGSAAASVEAAGDLLVIRRSGSVVVTNTGTEPGSVRVPTDLRPLLSSAESPVPVGDSWLLAGGTTTWFGADGGRHRHP